MTRGNGTQDRIPTSPMTPSITGRVSQKMGAVASYGWIKPVAFALALAGGVWAASAQFADKASRAQVKEVDKKVDQVGDEVQQVKTDVKVMQVEQRQMTRDIRQMRDEQRMLIRAIRPRLADELPDD